VKRLSAFLACFFLTPLFVFAQSTPQPKVTDEIVVTASAVPESVASTPASVTVVTKKEMDEQNARDIADVLREVPGLSLSRSGSDGKATSLFTRGANSQHTLVLWNGIEINDPDFSGYDWGRFSTLGVDQVEVVRGPFSAIYGSEAMAGVVNVLTNPRESGVHGVLEGGSHGLRNGALDAAWVSQTMQLTGSFEHRSDDGFDQNDDFRQNSGNAFWRWAPIEHLSLGLSARRTTYDLGIPFNVNAAGTAIVPSLERRQSGSERQLALPIQQTIGSFSYDLTLAESRRDDRFTDPQDPYGLTSSDTASRTRRARLTTRTTTSFGTIVAGAESESAHVDDVNNFGPNVGDHTRSSHGLFLEDRWSHDTGSGTHLEVSAGARNDHFSTFGSQTSPRLAVAWVTPSGKWRAAYGTGFRAPSIGELYFPFAGNLALHAEHSRSLEAGYDAAIGHDGLASVTLFTSNYRDLIVFDNATFLFGNVGRARSDGLELGLSDQLSAAFRAALSYTYLHKDENALTGQPLLRRPKNSGSLSLTYHRGEVDTNLVVIRSGSRLDVLPISPYSNVINGAYTTADISVQTHLGRVTPFVKVENLRNERYQEVLGFNSSGRRAIVGVKF
jgi:vitamin B12 transporter